VDGRLRLKIPSEHLLDKGGCRGVELQVELQVSGITRMLRIELVAEGRAGPGEQLARPQVGKATTTHPVTDQRALILGHGSTNLQQQLVVRVLRHGPLHKLDGTAMRVQFEFVERLKACYCITRLCRALGVSPSGYWAWRRCGPSVRAAATLQLREQIVAIHTASRATYGAPRIHAELRAQGVGCGRKRVARLMQVAGIAGCHRCRFHTTRRNLAHPSAPDLVQRAFVAAAPDQVWVADITYVPTGQGFLFLAVVLDVCSRRIIGWSMAAHLRAELVLAALSMALQHRRPAAGVIHHSDHGSQYTSQVFQDRCRVAGIRSSMGSVGDCYDNALAESFFANLECELLSRSSLRTHAEARAAIFDYIEVFYNRRRRHSALGYLSPESFERRRFTETPVVA
jgi:putative transposase